MSESNQVLVRYVPEVTYGDTPVDDTGWKTLPQNSDSISAKPITVESQRIVTTRLPADKVKVSLEAGGGIDYELSFADFDDMLEAAMCATWSTDVLTLGTVDHSFTVEKEFTDLTRFVQVQGARVDTLNLNFRFGEIVTGSLLFAGNNGIAASTSLVGSGSTAGISANAIMAANVDMDSVTYDGVSIATSGIEVEEITLSIANNMRPITNILNQAPVNQAKGTARVTGRMRAYLSTAAWALYTDMLANNGVDLAWTITDGAGKGYTFNLPNIKLDGEAPAGGGLDQDVMVEPNFAVITTAPTITRIP
jgi:hypothetical protein